MSDVEFPQPEPQSSFERPVPLVFVDPDVDADWRVQFRAEWLPYVLGSLQQLAQDTTWDTHDSDDLNLVQARVALLVDQFIDGVITLMDVRQKPTDENILQKSYDGTVWEDFADLTNTDGREVEFNNDNEHIRWRYVGDTDWTNLVALDDITGPQGATGSTGATGPAGPKIVGTIIPYATASAPSGTLPCDGTIYLKSAYPDLVAVLNSVYFTDSTHFKTPDLRDRTMIGTGGNNGNGSAIGAGLTARSQGDVVGEETHVLTTTELASHAHAAFARNTGSGAVNLIGQAANVATGADFFTTSTGGGGAHNNMQPSHAVGFCIVATA